MYRNLAVPAAFVSFTFSVCWWAQYALGCSRCTSKVWICWGPPHRHCHCCSKWQVTQGNILFHQPVVLTPMFSKFPGNCSTGLPLLLVLQKQNTSLASALTTLYISYCYLKC